MIKILDDFYHDLYSLHLSHIEYTPSYNYDSFYENMSWICGDLTALQTLCDYPLLIDIFEEYYCELNSYDNNELAYFMLTKLVLEYEDVILKKQRLQKLKKLRQ